MCRNRKKCFMAVQNTELNNAYFHVKKVKKRFQISISTLQGTVFLKIY